MRQRNKQHWYCTHLPLLCAIMLGIFAGGGTTFGQSFQYVYGGDNCIEDGFNGVEPITNCADMLDGYIAVGRTKSLTKGCTIWKAYVVRTRRSGANIWDNVYTIGAGNDEARSVSELAGGGFVVTGVTDQGINGNDIFVLRLDCNGGVVWSRTYGGSGDEDAWDVIEAANGDFIVAGSTINNTTGARDAYLLRVNPATGAIIWDRAFDGGGDEYFQALIETAIIGAGDIVAVGATTSYGLAVQGYVVRVNGLGNFGAAPLGTAVYGGFGDEIFYDVRERTVALPGGPFPPPPPVGAPAGELVYVGSTTTGPVVVGAPDIYVVRSAANPCNVVLQQAYGDTPGTGLNTDIGYGIREVVSGTIAGAPNGQLAITGKSNQTGSFDALLYAISPLGGGVPPMPINAAIGVNLYGGPGADEGWSLAEVPNNLPLTSDGFIICGSEKSNLQGAVPADPGDLYLIKTDGFGTSGCNEVAGTFVQWTPTWPVGCPIPVVYSIGKCVTVCVCVRLMYWERLLCLNPLGIGCTSILLDPNSKGGSNDGGSGNQSGSAENTKTSDVVIDFVQSGVKQNLTSYPNPVKRGNNITLELQTASRVDVQTTVSNTVGEVVFRSISESADNPVRIPISTKGWPAGTYMIKVTNGPMMETRQIVVIE